MTFKGKVNTANIHSQFIKHHGDNVCSEQRAWRVNRVSFLLANCEGLRTFYVAQPPMKSFSHLKTHVWIAWKSTFPSNKLLLKYCNNCLEKQFIKPCALDFSGLVYLDLSYPKLSYKMGFFFHSEPKPRRHLCPQPFQYIPSAYFPKSRAIWNLQCWLLYIPLSHVAFLNVTFLELQFL